VAGDGAFLAASAFLFAASAAGTVLWCRSMSAGMPMPGGWIMSMAWMRMPGQTWLGAFASFIGMWILMMVAMMLPSLVPMLTRYRQALRTLARGPRLSRATAIAAAGYFFVWALLGAAAYPLGAVLALAEMRWTGLARAVPIATGGAFLLAGIVQLSAFKARWLCRCRDAKACTSMAAPGAWVAWRSGLRLGFDCSACCTSLMSILLVGGVMDVGVMALVTVAIATERYSPHPTLAARAIGVLAIAAGAIGLARAFGRA
jgi:predicted metal-binding membrane protein